MTLGVIGAHGVTRGLRDGFGGLDVTLNRRLPVPRPLQLLYQRDGWGLM